MNINAPIQVLGGILVPLNLAYSQASLSGDRCAADPTGQFSSFVQTGRDGVPQVPGALSPSPLSFLETLTSGSLGSPSPNWAAARLGLDSVSVDDSTCSGSIQPVARRREDRMTPFIRSTVRFHSRALLCWVLVLASGVGLGLAAAEPAIPAGPAASPAPSAVSAAPSDAPSALEEAHAAKRAAASYQTAGALPEAAASWTQAAQAYERAGNFGEAALAWTEAASLHEQRLPRTARCRP